MFRSLFSDINNSKSSKWCDVGGGDASINKEGRASDVGRLVRGQEQRSVGDFVSLSEAAHGDVHQSPLLLLFSVEEAHQQLRLQRTRACARRRKRKGLFVVVVRNESEKRKLNKKN